MTEHTNDFRPLGPGWYTKYEDSGTDAGDYYLVPVPGLIRSAEFEGRWVAAGYIGGHAVEENPGRLIYRPDLAHLPGEVEIRVVDGVEIVRPEFTAHRRVIGPDTPWPKTVHAMEAN